MSSFVSPQSKWKQLWLVNWLTLTRLYQCLYDWRMAPLTFSIGLWVMRSSQFQLNSISVEELSCFSSIQFSSINSHPPNATISAEDILKYKLAYSLGGLGS